MKTEVAETSLQAYSDLRKSGKSSTQRARVFALLLEHPKGMTNAEIGAALGIQASTVAGRVNELKKCGHAAVLGVRKCQVTKNTAKVHGVANEH